MDEVAADRRLDDYTSITDPATGAARYEGPQEQEEAARLAGSRLADWNMANSVGPVARDPVLGGGMRDRANARMTMQRQLMDAQLPWSKLPMSADDATRKMNELELQDRVTTLTRLQEQLQLGGMTPDGAASVADGISRGVMPQEYLDAAGGASNVFGAGQRAVDEFVSRLPTGRHWESGVAYTPADIEALTKFGVVSERWATPSNVAPGLRHYRQRCVTSRRAGQGGRRRSGGVGDGANWRNGRRGGRRTSGGIRRRSHLRNRRRVRGAETR